MLSSEVSSREVIMAALDRLDAAFDEFASLSYDILTPPETLGLAERLERHRRAQPAIEHRLIDQLASQASPAELGGKNWSDVLQRRLGIGDAEACRRLDEAADLGPRRALGGERLEPRLPHVAKRQAAGEINAEHVKIIRAFFDKLPDAVDVETRECCEETLATVAAATSPTGLRKAADRLAALVNPDGEFCDADRARRRYLIIHRQGADGLSRIEGLLDPEACASLDAVLAKAAAPGKCNPEDETPCVDDQPSEDAVRRDTRSQAQRNHDGLKAAARAVLACGALGQHKGLPATIIVSTTLKELHSGAGQAVTAGGTLLPIRDVIRLASHAYHFLVVFDKHTEIPLYLGRSQRIASAGQRIVLHAKDRGCTAPGCTVPGYGCEVHHAQRDWSDGGQTNIDEETLACPPHNRLVTEGGWRTRKRKDGRTEWIPPPHLDRGQSRVNLYHHPEEFLTDGAPDDTDHTADDH